MKSIRLAAGIAALLLCSGALGDNAALQGTWKGPWYIGMSSGIARMEIAADGSGSIALTNLDEFGAKPVPLTKQSFDGKVFGFTAVGANGAALNMNLKPAQDARQLRGNGKYAGFGARMELQRAD